MVESVSRELILPAIRLDVPSRPTDQQVVALAERGTGDWTVSPRDAVLQQVTRLAVAAILRSRLTQAATSRQERQPLPDDPEQVTLAQLAALFRPHVGLVGQAFEVAVVEAVNAGVPAAVDPVREGLRRIGITGRDRLKMVALGLEKVPARARNEFWEGAKTSTTLTAVVGALAAGERDVSGLDRSDLTRADALVLAGGRITPVSFGSRPREAGASWLHVPVTFSRRQRGQNPEDPRRGGPVQVDVGLRAEHWVEVFETALDAVGVAMQQIDLGSRPRSSRVTGLTDALAQRLVAAKGRTLADVHASLREIDPFALEVFDSQVSTTSVPVAVPVVEDDHFVQLWLPSSALAGPLFTGSLDLFLGGGADYRQVGGAAPRTPGRSDRSERPDRSDRPAKRAAADRQPRETREPREPGSRPPRKGKRRPGPRPDAATPGAAAPAADAPAPDPAIAPGEVPTQAPTTAPVDAPAAAPAEAPAPVSETPPSVD